MKTLTVIIVIFLILSSCQKEPLVVPDSNQGNSSSGYLIKTETVNAVPFGIIADISFLGSEQVDGNTTFFYQVISGTKPSLSHWNLLILPAELGEGVEEVVILECSELYQQGKDGSLKKHNRELADLYWLIFDQGYSDDEVRTVSFTLEGIWFEGDVGGIAKGGKVFEEAVITGAVQVKPWSCGDPIPDERDGQGYATVQIGGQCWMAKNLAYLPFSTFPSIDSYTEPAYYVFDYFGNDKLEAINEVSFQIYGVLYNEIAAQTACPPGWSLPNDEDWLELERLLGMDESEIYVLGGREFGPGYRATGSVGNKLKATNGWSFNAGINSFGFTAIPGGSKIGGGEIPDFYFIDQGHDAYFWTSTSYDIDRNYFRYISSQEGISRGVLELNYGLSVRCIKEWNHLIE